MRPTIRPVSGTELAVALVLAITNVCPGEAGPAENTMPDAARMTMGDLLQEYKGGLNSHTQRWADVVNALRRCGDPLVQKLKDDLKDQKKETRVAAAHVFLVLGKGARTAVPDLIQAMSDEEPDVRAAAVSAAAPLKDPNVFFALTKAREDPSPRVRAAVLGAAFGCFDDARYAIAAVSLSDKDPQVHREALFQMNLLKDKRAVPLLIRFLDNKEVRDYVVRNGVRTPERDCDKAVVALDHIVKGEFKVSSDDTLEEKERKVDGWKQWWKDNGEKFLKDLYSEPEVRRYTK